MSAARAMQASPLVRADAASQTGRYVTDGCARLGRRSSRPPDGTVIQDTLAALAP